MLAWRAGKGEREFCHQSRRSHTHLTRWEPWTFGGFVFLYSGFLLSESGLAGSELLVVEAGWESRSRHLHPLYRLGRGSSNAATGTGRRCPSRSLARPLPAGGRHLQQAEKRADKVPPNEIDNIKTSKIEIKKKGAFHQVKPSRGPRVWTKH